MSIYYTRDGKSITFETFLSSTPFQSEDHIVAQTPLNNGIFISTVFLYFDHGSGEIPLLFETLVFFPPTKKEVLDGRRYCTEEEAKMGHAEFVEKYRNWQPGDLLPSPE